MDTRKNGTEIHLRVIIWDGVWKLGDRGVQVICCGDQGQPSPVTGEKPQGWLRERCLSANGYYEEVDVDHRAKEPLLEALKN